MNEYTFSPWLGALMLFSLFLPFLGLRYRHFGKLYTFIWTCLILMTLTIPTKAPQFIYIIAPFLFIVFAVFVFDAADNLKRFGAAALVIIFLPALLAAPRLISLYSPVRPGESMISVLDYFQKSVLPRHPVASAVNLQHFSPEGLAFHFWNWNAPVLADPAVGPDEMFDSARYFLAVSLDEKSPYQAEILDDSIYAWNAYLADKQRSADIQEFASRRFERIGVTARVYEKRAEK